MNRGDVLLARFPHPSGGRGKKRPVVVVQADGYNQTLRTLVVAQITKNLNMAIDFGDGEMAAIFVRLPLRRFLFWSAWRFLARQAQVGTVHNPYTGRAGYAYRYGRR